MIVADCNLLAYLLIEGEGTRSAEAVFLRDSAWAAPFLWRSEFRNVLTRLIRNRSMRLDDAFGTMAKAEKILGNSSLAVDSLGVLSEAASSGLSAYDAEYVALARRLSIPLVTSDRKVLAAVPTIACAPDAFLSS